MFSGEFTFKNKKNFINFIYLKAYSQWLTVYWFSDLKNFLRITNWILFFWFDCCLIKYFCFIIKWLWLVLDLIDHLIVINWLNKKKNIYTMAVGGSRVKAMVVLVFGDIWWLAVMAVRLVAWFIIAICNNFQ